MSENNLETNPSNNSIEIPKNSSEKSKNANFTPLQSALLIVLTLVVSIGGWYVVGKNFIWNDIDMKRVNQQVEFYKQKVQEQPNDASLRVYLGYSYLLKGKNDEAIKELNQALIIDPKNFDAFYNLGLVFITDEKYNEALANFTKAAELSPRDYKVHLQAGIAYRNLGMYDEAKEALNLANKLMPTNAEIVFEIGQLAEAQGQNEDAIGIYKDVLRYDPLYKPAIEALERLE